MCVCGLDTPQITSACDVRGAFEWQGFSSLVFYHQIHRTSWNHRIDDNARNRGLEINYSASKIPFWRLL